MIIQGRVAGPPEAAFQLTKAAADQGFVPAEFDIWMLYAAGIGTDQDLDAAKKWLKKLANEGYPDAQRNLDNLASVQTEAAEASFANVGRDWRFSGAPKIATLIDLTGTIGNKW